MNRNNNSAPINQSSGQLCSSLLVATGQKKDLKRKLS